jgi:hypothetical protein
MQQRALWLHAVPDLERSGRGNGESQWSLPWAGASRRWLWLFFAATNTMVMKWSVWWESEGYSYNASGWRMCPLELATDEASFYRQFLIERYKNNIRDSICASFWSSFRYIEICWLHLICSYWHLLIRFPLQRWCRSVKAREMLCLASPKDSRVYTSAGCAKWCKNCSIIPREIWVGWFLLYSRSPPHRLGRGSRIFSRHEREKGCGTHIRESRDPAWVLAAAWSP